jgi:thiamine biosynthesis lipoprotein
VSTSGTGEQNVEIGGVRYAHVVDPRTGLGVTTRRTVTVVASDAATADALATALVVLGAIDGAAVLARFPDVLVVRR